MRFGVVILDEAHKARTRQGFGKEAGTPNELLAFMREIAARADHVLLARPRRSRPTLPIYGTCWASCTKAQAASCSATT
jgi:hypothetical protein